MAYDADDEDADERLPRWLGWALLMAILLVLAALLALWLSPVV